MDKRMQRLKFLVFLCLPSSVLLNLSTEHTKQCRHIMKSTFKNCTSRDEEMQWYTNGRINRILDESTFNASLYNQSDGKCSKSCRSLYRTARIYGQSLGLQIYAHVAEMLLNCCGGCTKYHLTKLYTRLEDLDEKVPQTFDFIYPVYADSETKNMHGFHFFPVLNIPSAYYITLKVCQRFLGSEYLE